MSILRSGTTTPRYTSMQVQTSASAVPVQICWGRQAVVPNVIWMNGFESHSAGSHGGGGKGGGGGNYDYSCGFQFALGEGPIKNLWYGSGVGFMYNNGTLINLWTINSGLYSGTWPQPVWYDNNFGYQMLPYPGIAHIDTNYLDLGSSNTPPSLGVEVYGLLDPSTVNTYQNIKTLSVNGAGEHGGTYGTGGGGYGGDVDPAMLTLDFLINPQYGVRFPAQYIDYTTLLSPVGNGATAPNLNDGSYQTYCYAQFLAMSPLLTDQQSANSILTRWLQLTNTAAVWSGGKLKFIPYGDTEISETYNSIAANFTPNSNSITPVYYLTDDDFVHDGDADPVQCKRTDPYEISNWIYIEFLDRGNYYTATPLGAFDQDYINKYGLRMGSTIQAHEICDYSVAQNSVQLNLQRQLYIRNTYTFKLSFEYCLLDPMDIVALTDPGLGLYQAPVRIISIEEGDDGLLTIEAEEFPGGVGTATAYNVAKTNPSTVNNRNAAPSAVNPPIIFEPPASLTNNVAQVWAAVSASVPPVQLLTENSSTGNHSAAWQGIPGASGDTAIFSVQVAMPAANARTAVAILASDTVNTSECDFLLSATAPGTATPASGNFFSSYSITQATVSGLIFFTLTVSIPINAGSTVTPVFGLYLANGITLPLTSELSYAGGGTDGIYVWGAQTATFVTNTATPASETLTGILDAPGLTGATLTNEPGITTPEGVLGGAADANWGGCYVWASTDGVNYANIGTVNAQARMGVATSATSMGAVAGLDQTSTLVVDLIESGGALTAGTPANAAAGTTLCLVDQELIAYSGLVLASGGDGFTYTIGQAAFSGINGEIARGLYGTVPAAHTAGAAFARLDSNVFTYNLPSQYIGTALYFKFQSFNVFGNAVQDISECAEWTYVPTGAGVVGVVLQNLAAGANADLGKVAAAVSEDDTCGAIAGVSISYDISLGNI